MNEILDITFLRGLIGLNKTQNCENLVGEKELICQIFLIKSVFRYQFDMNLIEINNYTKGHNISIIVATKILIVPLARPEPRDVYSDFLLTTLEL